MTASRTSLRPHRGDPQPRPGAGRHAADGPHVGDQRGGLRYRGAQLSDDEVLKVVAKEAKKRREASSAYTDAGRAELANREDAELAVIEAYLPERLGDEEIEALVA